MLTYDDEITYEKLVKLIYFIRKGIPYYATHSDLVCPTPEGSIPDIGCYINLVETVTKIKPNKIFGKPELSFIKSILDKHGLVESDAVVIGDRLYTDIELAEDSEIISVLVLSGETKRDFYEFSKIKADIVVPSLEELKDYL